MYYISAVLLSVVTPATSIVITVPLHAFHIVLSGYYYVYRIVDYVNKRIMQQGSGYKHTKCYIAGCQ